MIFPRVMEVDGITVIFERMPVFSKIMGSFSNRMRMSEFENYVQSCFLTGGDGVVVECHGDDIAPKILYCNERKTDGDTATNHAAVMDRELREHIFGLARKMIGEMPSVDLIVIPVFDTVITSVGENMQCVSLFSVEGYMKE